MNGEVILIGKVVLIALFTAVFTVEIFLSHQNGNDSGVASRSLSNRLRIPEQLIRTGAHIGFFAVLTFLSLYISKLLCVAVILWAIIDEATKPLLKNERHFSLIDVGWNIVGVVIGIVAWMLVTLQ